MSNLLVHHALAYFVARGVPGLVNFAAIAVYTRLLTAQEFGRYAVVLSLVGLVHVMVFQAVQLVAMRFMPSRGGNQRIIQGHVQFLFLWVSACVVALALLALIWVIPSGWKWLAVVGLLVVLAEGWHEMNLKVSAILLQPRVYGLLSATKAVAALALGAWLAWLGVGAGAPLVGLAVGMLAASLVFGSRYWRGIRPRAPGKNTLRAYLAYGLPLSATFLLVWVVSSSDRIIIAQLLNDSATGIYAAGYDLAQSSLILLLSIINTAATPLAINALEKQGMAAARNQMADNGELIFVFALAGAAGLIALTGPIMNLFVGDEFRAGAILIFPWIVVSAAITGIKSFYFDIAFHIAKNSKWLIVTSGVAAVVNVASNYLLIPRYGIVGAAWATVAAFAVAALCSYILGRRVFPMPPTLPMLIKSLVLGIIVYGAAITGVAATSRPSMQLLLALSLGCATFVVGAWALNAGRARLFLQELRNQLK